MNTLIIEPKTIADYQLFVNLAKRLDAKYRNAEINVHAEKVTSSVDEAFFALAGSFDLPETADEIIELIENSRTNKDIDTSWTK